MEQAWEIVANGGAIGILFLAAVILYREYQRVVRQRDQLFNLLIKSIQSNQKSASVAEELLSLREDGGNLSL